MVTTKVATIDGRSDSIATYLRVLKQSADSFNADFESALNDLEPIYGVPRQVLAVALKRQFPNPIISDKGIQGLHTGVRYLIELDYLKEDNIDELLDLRHQPV